MKKILFVIVVSIACTQAHAGWWDSITDFFGGDQPNQTQTASTPSDKTSGMIQKGVALIPLLTQVLGVSENQAQGGMGSILQAAKILLSGTEYETLINSIPNASSLIDMAPKSDSEAGGLMNKALSALGENNETIKAGTQLLSQFNSLDMSADMIPKFTETAGQFLKQSNASEAASLLKQLSNL